MCHCEVFPDFSKSQYSKLISSHNPLLSICVSSHSNLFKNVAKHVLIGSPQRLCLELIGPYHMLAKVQGQFALVDFLLAAFPRQQFPTKHWCSHCFYCVVTHCHHRGAKLNTFTFSFFTVKTEICVCVYVEGTCEELNLTF